jgi:hypothetical protein
MARGTTTPCWNSSSVHGKALEARISQLYHGGQLIDGQTTFQEVIDGVPELSMYSRDALRRAAKAFAIRFGVNLAMNGKFHSTRLIVPRWPISTQLLDFQEAAERQLLLLWPLLLLLQGQQQLRR